MLSTIQQLKAKPFHPILDANVPPAMMHSFTHREAYDAIRAAMACVKQQFPGRRIGYPKIGAGLAGGDWDIIRAIIEEELAGEDHCLVEFVPERSK